MEHVGGQLSKERSSLESALSSFPLNTHFLTLNNIEVISGRT